MDDESPLLTAQQVAERVGGRVKAATVLAARRQGRLVGTRIGRGWSFRPEDVDDWVARMREIPLPLKAPTAGLVGPSALSRARLQGKRLR